MSKTSLSIAFVVATLPALAHAENMLTIGFGLHGAYATGDLKSYGVGGNLELKYNVNGFLSAGLRGEVDGLLGAEVDSGGSGAKIGGRAAKIYMAKAEVYAFPTGVRPFAGVGFGIYQFGSATVEGSVASAGTTGTAVKETSNTGLSPQVGINLGGFRLAATYHMIFGKADVAITTGTTQESSMNFFVFELGGQIGIL